LLLVMIQRPTNGYKSVWDDLSTSEDHAVLNISGQTEDMALLECSEVNRKWLVETVGLHPEDTILDIGCGVARMAKVLAPGCREWIGADVSPNMLAHARKRTAGFENVRLVEISGYDLAPIADASIDLVYCMVVFCHLNVYDRYSYVCEAYRVLRPAGRMFIDNFSLSAPRGWETFEKHRAIPPAERPPQLSTPSTSEELITYLDRAGFEKVRSRTMHKTWIQAYGAKPYLYNG
jgi:ubiquinone/menaquinone biosynthesis C-methylase UbiE